MKKSIIDYVIVFFACLFVFYLGYGLGRHDAKVLAEKDECEIALSTQDVKDPDEIMIEKAIENGLLPDEQGRYVLVLDTRREGKFEIIKTLTKHPNGYVETRSTWFYKPLPEEKTDTPVEPTRRTYNFVTSSGEVKKVTVAL